MPEIIELTRDWIVAVKPWGVLPEDAAGEAGMPALLKDKLKTRGILCGQVFTVHRLDRTTEGLTVYALTKKGAALLSRSVAEGTFRKTYAAFVTADPGLPEEGEMRDWLWFDRRRDKAFVASSPRPGAKEADRHRSPGRARNRPDPPDPGPVRLPEIPPRRRREIRQPPQPQRPLALFRGPRIPVGGQNLSLHPSGGILKSPSAPCPRTADRSFPLTLSSFFLHFCGIVLDKSVSG